MADAFEPLPPSHPQTAAPAATPNASNEPFLTTRPAVNALDARPVLPSSDLSGIDAALGDATPGPVARPSSPSPSTIPEPALPEPSAAASVGVLLVMVGIMSAIVVLVVAIIAAVIFAVVTHGRSHSVVARRVPVGTPPTVHPPTLPATSSRVAPPPPAVATPTPVPTKPAEHGPFVGSMSPSTGNVGDLVTLHGRGLGAVEDIILFPQHGGAAVETAVKSVDDRSVTFAVPAVGKPEGFQPGDGYYVGVFSKTGACLLVDNTFRSLKPTDTAVVAHDAVRVKFGSPLTGGDRLLVYADAGATVRVGVNCIVLLRPNCLLKDYGGGCKIFYMPPLRGMSPDADGLIPMTDIRLSLQGPRLMLKPPGDLPDPN